MPECADASECEEYDEYRSIEDAQAQIEASKNIRYNHETSRQYVV